MPSDFRSASLVDGVRFTAQIALPNVIQGLFVKRALPVRAGAALHGDHLGYLLMQGLVRRLGPDPFWVRVGTDRALLVHHPDDLEIVLGGSPEPFAADPASKRKGMAAFQPHALTISRGDLWRNRRRFAEAVLDTGTPLHRLAPDLLGVAGDEADRLARQGTARWGDVNRAFQRLTRRVVFGEAAAQDTALTAELGELMSAGNRLPGKPAAGYEPFRHRVQKYIDVAQPGSLCSLVAGAPADTDTDPAGQLIHWLFAMGDTLAANVFRTLAVLATHDEQRALALAQLDGADLTQPQWVVGADHLAGCLQEAMRLWPTTQLYGRVAIADVRWPDGKVLPAGSNVLIYNLFNHRNRDRVPFADRFAPEQWISGGAADDWSFNFFSHGPQGCPGAGLAMFLGQAVLARLLTTATVELTGADLDPDRPLPHALDLYGITVRLSAE